MTTECPSSVTRALLEGFPVHVRLPVQWGDQDAFGHVNNTVYLRWFETARIAYSDRAGLLQIDQSQRLAPILAAALLHKEPLPVEVAETTPDEA